MHDVHCRIAGPAAWDLLQTFLMRWDHQRGAVDIKLIGRDIIRPPPLPPDAQARKTLPGTCSVAIARTFNPVNGTWRPERDVKALFKCVINNAKRHVYIEDQYVVNLEAAQLLNSIVPRLESLIVLMPRSEISDLPCKWTYRKRFVDLLYRGLGQVDRNKIVIANLLLPGTSEVHTYVHAKSWFADDEIAVIGSANLNRRGWEHDSEVNAFIFDDTLPGKGQLTFAQKMRSLLWHEHLNVDESRVVDPVARAALWRSPPAGANIQLYNPTGGSDFSHHACSAAAQFVDPPAAP
jgi:phosphatidylserine/phosphatidylglycerophosphate/cardiolipin synthase-like enzyme